MPRYGTWLIAMLDTLRRITLELNNAADLDQGLAVVVHGVKEYLAVDACSVYLVDASDTSFVLVATDGFDPRAVGSVRFGRGEGLVGLVIERQRLVSLSNAQDHPRFRHLPEFGERAHHAFLGVPITHLRKPLGALIVRQLNDRVFGSDEEAFMMAIAAELAGLANDNGTRSAQGVNQSPGHPTAHPVPRDQGRAGRWNR